MSHSLLAKVIYLLKKEKNEYLQVQIHSKSATRYSSIISEDGMP